MPIPSKAPRKNLNLVTKPHDLHLHPISQRALAAIATTEADKKVLDIDYSSAWSTDTSNAPSMAVLYTKIESIGGTSDLWTSQGGLAASGDVDTIYRKSGSVGIGPEYIANIAAGKKLHVVGDTLLEGNLQVDGTTTYVNTTQLQIGDNIIELNADISGSTTPTQDSGMLINRGNANNVQLYWNETTNRWELIDINGDDYYLLHSGKDSDDIGEGSSNLYFTNARAVSAIGGTVAANVTGTNTGDISLSLASGVASGSATLSGQGLTIANKFIHNEGVANAIGVDGGADGKLSCFATEGNSGTTALVCKGGNSISSNSAVSITGHLEATTKSFNIPHPLYKNKRLIHGSLEGPEFGLYCRGMGEGVVSAVVELPNYWEVLAHKDYTVILTPKGPYAVYLKSKLNDSFVVESTNKGMFGKRKAFEFEYLVIGERTDAKMVVERDA